MAASTHTVGAAASGQSRARSSSTTINHRCRCILVLDIDAFYAQVEELREPKLRDQPMAVFQKFLVITCNYQARAKGVTKLMCREEAQAKCPELVLRSAEDTTPYRKASKEALAVLLAWAERHDGVVVERLGMDEFCLDISTAAAAHLAEQPTAGLEVVGHTYMGQAERIGTAEGLAGRGCCYRPMDIRAEAAATATAADASGCPREDQSLPCKDLRGEEELAATPLAREPWLVAGTQLAAELRKELKEKIGLRTSAGIARSRLLAKLASGLHKPDAQTVLPSCFAIEFLDPLPIVVLPGVGYKLKHQLEAAGFATVSSLKEAPTEKLAAALCGEEASGGSGSSGGSAAPRTQLEAKDLQILAVGDDVRPVKPAKPPVRISVEDSFRRCMSRESIHAVLEVLVPDLLARVDEDGRQPRQLVVSWRQYGSRTMNNPDGEGRRLSSRTVQFPALAGMPEAQANSAIVAKAEDLLMRALNGQEFHLTKINLAATGFAPAAGKQSSLAASLGCNSRSRSSGGAGQALDEVADIHEPAEALTAKASESFRSDYSSGGPIGRLLSKTAERKLRENSTSQVLAAVEREGTAEELPSQPRNNSQQLFTRGPSSSALPPSRSSLLAELERPVLDLLSDTEIDSEEDAAREARNGGGEEVRGEGGGGGQAGESTGPTILVDEEPDPTGVGLEKVMITPPTTSASSATPIEPVLCVSSSDEEERTPQCEREAGPGSQKRKPDQLEPDQPLLMQQQQQHQPIQQQQSRQQKQLEAFFAAGPPKKLARGPRMWQEERRQLPQWQVTGPAADATHPQLVSHAWGLHVVPAVPGVFLFVNFLSEREEESLLKWLESTAADGSHTWHKSIFNGECNSKNWGAKTDFGRRSVRPPDVSVGEHEMPEELQVIAAKFRSIDYGSARDLQELMDDFQPNEANANEYVRSRGDSLTPHFDDRFLSGKVLAGVSLAADCVMTYHAHPSGKKKLGSGCPGCCACARSDPEKRLRMPTSEGRRVYLPRRSLQLVTGASRFEYTHSIDAADLPADGQRVSIIFRQAKCPWPV